MNNEDLVLQAKKGDMESFSKLYEIYKNSIYYFALKNVKNKNDAEEIVQETFMEAFKRIDTLTDANAFKSWIFSNWI